MSQKDLIRRIEDLETAVHREPREASAKKRRMVPWTAVLVVGMLGGWLGRFVTEPWSVNAQGAAGQNLTARSLTIVDDNGRPTLQFTHDMFGGVVRVSNSTGKVIASLEGDADGGFLKVNGPDGVERGFFGVGVRQGGGLIYLRSAEGKNVPIEIGVGGKGGYVSLANLEAAKRSVWLGSSDDGSGGMIGLYDAAANLRVQQGVNAQGGMISLFGSKSNRSHVYLGTGSLEMGGVLLLRDSQEQVRSEFGLNKAGGYLSLNSSRSTQPTLTLANGADHGGGYVQVRNAAGKVRVETGVDNRDEGYLDIFDGK